MIVFNATSFNKSPRGKQKKKKKNKKMEELYRWKLCHSKSNELEIIAGKKAEWENLFEERLDKKRSVVPMMVMTFWNFLWNT